MESLTAESIVNAALALQHDGYGLWLASNGPVLEELSLSLGELAITPLDFLGPYEREWRLEDLMRTYNVLNATAFGAKGIPLQSWVMIDLGLLPSGFLLLTLPRARVEEAFEDPGRSDADRARLRGVLPAVLAEADRLGYGGPIPVAGYCAAPTPDRRAWVGWSLCSAIPGLGTVAKGLGLLAYGADTLTGVTQFHDPALRVHRKFGPMRLLAAVLDLHPVRGTMAYRTEVFGREPELEPTLMLDAHDLAAQWTLQRRLDAGTHEYFVLSPGLVGDRVPILERPHLMPDRTSVLAFSGGLDTSFGLAVLVDRGERVITATVNTGGFSDPELAEIAARSAELGAIEHVVVDGRARLYEEFVSDILRADYRRGGVYPSCVGVERMLQAEEVVQVALARGAAAIAHGSTGAGNDHVRFDAVAKAMAPELEIVGLIRDGAHTREEERDFLRARGVAVSDATAEYSFNFGILGTTIGGGETYGSWEYLPEAAWPTTTSVADAPAEPAELVISFSAGLPSGVEVVSGPVPDDAFTGAIGIAGYDTLAALNRIGAFHGYGRGIHTGQTIMGIIGRLGFEAPGMLLLIAAHHELERLVLTQAQQNLKASLGTTFGDMLHEGRYYDPILDDIRAFLRSSQRAVSGEVRVRLHKAGAVMLGTRSPHSLLDAGRALGSTYGHGSSLWTGEEARAFAHVYAVAGMLTRSTGAAESE